MGRAETNPIGVPGAMIVCSCNVLSDVDVRSALNEAAPRTAGEVYGCLGCSPQCGGCAPTIRQIIGGGGTHRACPTRCHRGLLGVARDCRSDRAPNRFGPLSCGGAAATC